MILMILMILVFIDTVCSLSNDNSENEAGQSLPLNESYLEVRGVAAGSIDPRDYVVSDGVPSFKNFTAPLMGAPRYVPEIRIDGTDSVNLENYNTSPRKYQEARIDSIEGGVPVASGSGNALYSFESYGTVEKRNFRDYNKFGQTASNPAGPSAKVLCNAEVEARMNIGTMPDVTLAVSNEVELLPVETKTGPIPDIANTTERKQPDGEEKAPEIIVTDCENVGGMLDRISHDLDYLLNRKHGMDEASDSR